MGLLRAFKEGREMARAKEAAPEAWTAGQVSALSFMDLGMTRYATAGFDEVIMYMTSSREALHEGSMRALQDVELPNHEEAWPKRKVASRPNPELKAFGVAFMTSLVDLVQAVRRDLDELVP